MSDTIKTSNFSQEFREEIFEEPGADKIALCFNCTGCSSGCPMTEQEPEFNIRKFLRMANLGMKDELLNNTYIWYCTTCYKCQERCPQGVHNVDALLKIRTIAVHNGIMLPVHKKVGQLVVNYGHAVPINDATKEKRKKLGLDEVPPTVHSFPDALDEVKTLLHIAGFDKIVAKEEEEK
ncbi:MAG: CoB--CoM heterodisulfide reductase subunit C [Methanosarcinaceae archaeon]|nr:CoB--CoM heterodisulfide reductase subunit C [Methanosarcinaceae archaeon]